MTREIPDDVARAIARDLRMLPANNPVAAVRHQWADLLDPRPTLREKVASELRAFDSTWDEIDSLRASDTILDLVLLSVEEMPPGVPAPTIAGLPYPQNDIWHDGYQQARDEIIALLLNEKKTNS